jgi:hypothetical protein
MKLIKFFVTDDLDNWSQGAQFDGRMAAEHYAKQFALAVVEAHFDFDDSQVVVDHRNLKPITEVEAGMHKVEASIEERREWLRDWAALRNRPSVTEAREAMAKMFVHCLTTFEIANVLSDVFAARAEAH